MPPFNMICCVACHYQPPRIEFVDFEKQTGSATQLWRFTPNCATRLKI
jgi:hypothetical protein